MLDSIHDLIAFVISDNSSLLLLLASGMPIVAIVLIVTHLMKVKQDVRRRVVADPGQFATTTLAPKARIANRLQSAVENLANLTGEAKGEGKAIKDLQFKLIQAGYFSTSAIAFYFGLRLITGAVLMLALTGAAMFFGYGEPLTRLILLALGSFIVGYFLPAVALSRRLERIRLEHRSGFPDFMDLMVVCSQAGMSMEAGMKRIADELSFSYPSLSRHLELACIEIRTGRTVSRAIDAFAKRLGIEEAGSFATLLAQSEELGSSLSQSLRAYSDDMRNKRLMKAEEKAFSLPAKLVVPLTLFVFPTLLVVIMLPVIIAVTSSS